MLVHLVMMRMAADQCQRVCQMMMLDQQCLAVKLQKWIWGPNLQKCWNTGSLSTEALKTTVVVGVSMNEDGTPDTGTIRMISSSGGTGGSVQQAFQAARRAIIRCGARGFALPSEKYEQWRDIEMTFNPEKMRIK